MAVAKASAEHDNDSQFLGDALPLGVGNGVLLRLLSDCDRDEEEVFLFLSAERRSKPHLCARHRRDNGRDPSDKARGGSDGALLLACDWRRRRLPVSCTSWSRAAVSSGEKGKNEFHRL